jgi:hypothetical protein
MSCESEEKTPALQEMRTFLEKWVVRVRNDIFVARNEIFFEEMGREVEEVDS